MKFSHIVFGLLLLLSFSCVKKNNDSGKQSSTSGSAQIERVLFTDPSIVRGKNSDTQIMDSLIVYFDAAPKGSKIFMSIYLITYKPLLNAITLAYNRGVELHLMIDSSRSSSSRNTNKLAITQFRYLLKAPSEVIVVNSDVTDISINHEKYVLFSKVNLYGHAKNIVFNTSHNFTLSGTKKVQDAVIMTNKELYSTFLNNWKEVASRARSGMKYFTYYVDNIGDSIKIFFFPRRENGAWDKKDNILEVLDGLDKEDYSKDTIRVFMASWNSSRIKIAQKLVDLQKEGVSVEVIARGSTSEAVLLELGKIEKNEGYLKVIDMDIENVHSKVMLLKGRWKGQNMRMVLCGSHNYTGGALWDNNETLLMLKNSILFGDYWNYFAKLKKVF